jgi:hypothetical protein
MREGQQQSSIDGEARKAEVELPEIEPRVFGHLQRFLYTGEVSVEPDDLLPLFRVAHTYAILPLAEVRLDTQRTHAHTAVPDLCEHRRPARACCRAAWTRGT